MATIRRYDPDRDFPAIYDIWRSIGWTSPRDDAEEAVRAWLQCGDSWVTDVDGRAESLVTMVPAEMRYLDRDLTCAVVGAVTTSRTARRRGYATDLTAHALRRGVAEYDADCSALGMFEQGYYDRFGFGTGSYLPLLQFPPAALDVPVPDRPPEQLDPTQWREIHANRRTSTRGHGSIVFDAPETTREQMLSKPERFGFGFRDDDGDLTHHAWLHHDPGRAEAGPYVVDWLAYRTRDQFLDLMGCIANLGEQVASVVMLEPNGVQLQPLIENFYQLHRTTSGGDHETKIRCDAWCQTRICDLERCLAALRPAGHERLTFNLELTDPLCDLPTTDQRTWNGCPGSWTIDLTSETTVTPGTTTDLPTLHASVNALSRLWLGVRPPTALATTDDLDAPEGLLRALDRQLRLPTPNPSVEL